jgi:hypothetical protein
MFIIEESLVCNTRREFCDMWMHAVILLEHHEWYDDDQLVDDPSL